MLLIPGKIFYHIHLKEHLNLSFHRLLLLTKEKLGDVAEKIMEYILLHGRARLVRTSSSSSSSSLSLSLSLLISRSSSLLCTHLFISLSFYASSLASYGSFRSIIKSESFRILASCDICASYSQSCLCVLNPISVQCDRVAPEKVNAVFLELLASRLVMRKLNPGTSIYISPLLFDRLFSHCSNFFFPDEYDKNPFEFFLPQRSQGLQSWCFYFHAHPSALRHLRYEMRT